MEGREGMNSGVTVIGAESPSAYHVAPRTENPSQSLVTEPAAVGTQPLTAGSDGIIGKKKRGRPRKYGPDGAVSMALSPLPISSSAPPANEFSTGKRGKGKGMEYKKHKTVGIDQIGGLNGSSIGISFMPHIITVNAGEDITMKVISFSQQGPRAICILSANGVISNVTLRQPDSSGGTLTYEGRFEILSLSGSFMPTESQGTRSRSGGMSVSLASPDGRVVGGSVAGLLVAASPVQVVVGSFLPSNQHDQKPKKLKHDYAPSAIMPASTMASATPLSNAEKEDGMGGHGLQNSGTMNSNITPSSNFRRENWVTMHAMQDSRNSGTDINISLPDI
ncbi:AT-hook motif nuclear-localized protein [Quillaja saponaria]|uniref:AT-hook motif nuclear-localized protein n=1 Tax=Quillaja saponaria TaxID=32244 RepID=A0AAD7L411_QUISA|nr:AT-hook motif nuclear-localized protein [Quillaja saponaria]KAJ7950993.1 AT-hook motif nuclear-localized protein [Quillaja saponaria]